MSILLIDGCLFSDLSVDGIFISFLCSNIFQTSKKWKYFWKNNHSAWDEKCFFQRNIFQKSSSVIFDRKFWVWISPSGVKSGGFGAKLQNLKKPWFLGFECQFSGFLQVSVYGFGSGSSSKKVGFYPKDYGIFGFITNYKYILPFNFKLLISKFWFWTNLGL